MATEEGAEKCGYSERYKTYLIVHYSINELIIQFTISCLIT